MDLCKLAYGIIIILHLVILLGIHQTGASEIDSDKWSRITVGHDQNQTSKQIDSIPENANVLRLRSMDIHDQDQGQEHNKKYDAQLQEFQTRHVHSHVRTRSSSHMISHVDPSTVVFFFLHDLKLGKTMPIYFPDRDPSSSSSPHSLPKEEADNIPFTLQQLPNILQLFSFPQGSPQAIAMEDTLRQCEIDPIKGETKFCATSYESMLNFAREILGSETNISVLSTIHLTKSAAGIREYTIMKVPQQISAPKMVTCHTMPYPYTVYYCHYQESESRVYRISLYGENGERVEAIAVCHMDTSQWSPSHVSFHMLGIEPGSSPVCHFLPADNFVLVPSSSSM